VRLLAWNAEHLASGALWCSGRFPIRGRSRGCVGFELVEPEGGVVDAAANFLTSYVLRDDGLLVDLVSGHRLSEIAAISCGRSYAAAIDGDGRVLFWRCGSPDVSRVEAPPACGVAQGGEHGLILCEDGSVRLCCGAVSVPVKLSYPVVAIAAGVRHFLALDETGQVWGWGGNEFHQVSACLAPKTLVERPTPVPELVGQRVIAVSAGGYYSAALTDGGLVYVWGVQVAERGMIRWHGNQPVLLPAAYPVSHISAGANHLILRTEDDALWGIGCGYHGQLGCGPAKAAAVDPVSITIPWTDTCMRRYRVGASNDASYIIADHISV
jgi:hypothetical protein